IRHRVPADGERLSITVVKRAKAQRISRNARQPLTRIQYVLVFVPAVEERTIYQVPVPFQPRPDQRFTPRLPQPCNVEWVIPQHQHIIRDLARNEHPLQRQLLSIQSFVVFVKDSPPARIWGDEPRLDPVVAWPTRIPSK